MPTLLVWKERMKTLYDHFGQYIKPALHFLLALVTILVINSQFGYNPAMKNPLIVIAFSVVSIFLPIMVFLFAVCMVLVLHIWSVSMVLGIQVALVFLILYFVYVRFVPEHGYVILLLPILYFLKIPYLMPLILGLISNPVATIPMGVGVIVYYLLIAVRTETTTLLNTTAAVSEENLQNYNNVIKAVINDRYMVCSIAVFALVVVVLYFIRRQKWNYASYIAVLAGVITNVLGFLVVDFMLGQSEWIGGMLVSTIFSALAVAVVQFLRLTLDYSAIEILQFEDDEYYYYVKAIPKMNITKPEKHVTRINPQKENEHTANLRDAIQQAYSEDRKYVESIPEFTDDMFDDMDDFVVEYDEKDFMDD